MQVIRVQNIQHGTDKDHAMKCVNCEHQMEFIFCTDNPNKGYAYNLYACPSCDSITKKDVWKNKGFVFINADSSEVIREKE